ncbi:LytTR family transcriptional regulator [Lactococcus kimchii]|nr:LytTR family transcriptional regulator [Lactococcus sp. S-13]
MASIMIDAEFHASNRLERFVFKAQEELEIREKVYSTRVFYNHEDSFRYLKTFCDEVKVCFIKVATKQELEILKRMQTVKTKAFFVIYTDNSELDRELLALTTLPLWTHMTLRGNDENEIQSLVNRVLAYNFTNNLKTVEVSGYPIALDSVLYILADKTHRNYLKAVTKDNECLVRGTLQEVRIELPELLSLGRGLLVNPKKIRRIEEDGLTLCFEESLKKIKAPAVCKSQLKVLKQNSEWIK